MFLGSVVLTPGTSASNLGVQIAPAQASSPIPPSHTAQIEIRGSATCTEQDLEPNTQTSIQFRKLYVQYWELEIVHENQTVFIDSSQCADPQYQANFTTMLLAKPSIYARALHPYESELVVYVTKSSTGNPWRRVGDARAPLTLVAAQAFDIDIHKKWGSYMYHRVGLPGETLTFPITVINNGNGEINVSTRVESDPINDAFRYLRLPGPLVLGPHGAVGGQDVLFEAPASLTRDDFFRFSIVTEAFAHPNGTTVVREETVTVEIRLNAAEPAPGFGWDWIVFLAAALAVSCRRRRGGS